MKIHVWSLLRRVARILHWGGGGGHRSCKGALFFSKKLTPFFSRRRQNLSSSSSGVDIFQAHRTLLIERTVLLYWIKAGPTSQQSQFSVKKSTKSTVGGGMPPANPPATPLSLLGFAHNILTGLRHCLMSSLYCTDGWKRADRQQ